MVRRKEFNITGVCIPEVHYMVDTSSKIEQIIQNYIRLEKYFTINRARQYGKTTTLNLLYKRLKEEYIILDLSFEGKEEYFSSLQTLAGGLCYSFREAIADLYDEMLQNIFDFPENTPYPMQLLSSKITEFCKKADKKVILMIDEVDKAADNATFLTFLGMLRDKYLNKQRRGIATFSSVILVGVHDIKNLKMKIRPEEGYNYNSPWNIAVSFDVDMSFSTEEIATMLKEYSCDAQVDMDIVTIAQELYVYTSGYPFLVSCLCKRMDDEHRAWTKEELRNVVKEVLSSTNTLFDDIIKNLEKHSRFKNLVEAILLQGEEIPFIISDPEISMGLMYGILKKEHGRTKISNQIFETYIYEYLISRNRLNIVII